MNMNNDLFRKPTIGSWLTIPHPSIPEIIKSAGFDWFAIDLEHSHISIETALELIRVIDLLNIIPFVRVGDHSPLAIKRLMDAGAQGIIASTVNTVQEAEQIVKSVKYPPLGNRGVGLSRAQDYGNNFKNYFKTINEHSIVILQIEHYKAVENLDAMLTVKGVDGVFIGPYDLSASLGIAGDINNSKMKDVMNKIKIITQFRKKLLGIHVVNPDINKLKEVIENEYNFIAYGIDYLFMLKKAEELKKLKHKLL